MKLAAIVALGAVLTACNGASDAAPEPSPSPSVVAASPSPSPEPEPSPSPTELLPANDVADPVAALEAIVRFRDELFEDPNPDKLALIYAERCPCYEEVYEVLRAFAADGRYIEVTEPRAYEFLREVDRQGPTVTLRYRVGGPGFTLYAADGSVLEKSEASEPGEVEAVLVSENGRWRVVTMVED